MDERELWDLIDDLRATTAELFATLPAPQWDTPSLCDGWTVREVAAHLTLQSMGPVRTLRLALRHPGPVNHVIDACARSSAARLTRREIVDRLRALVGVHRPNAFTTVDETLVDAVVHLLDAAEPLGVSVDIDERAKSATLDRLAFYHRTGRTAVFHDVTTAGILFVADDLDWSWGSGRSVAASATELLLVLSGRRRSYR